MFSIHRAYRALFFLLGLIFFLSCESDLPGGVRSVDSKMWIKSIVGSNEEVRLYLGSTSGLNSMDIASYRSDATVWFYVNSDIQVKLDYKEEDSLEHIGYYFKERLANAKPGDSLSFEAWIDDTDFSSVSGSTRVPYPVAIDSVDVATIGESVLEGLKSVNLNIYLGDTTLNEDRYYQLEIQSLEYSDIEGISLAHSCSINPSNDLILGYGQTWNQYLRSILVHSSGSDNSLLSMQFYVKDAVSNRLKIKLSTITSDYYNYAMSLDNGGVCSTNINNGVGVFSGASSQTKVVKID